MGVSAAPAARSRFQPSGNGALATETALCRNPHATMPQIAATCHPERRVEGLVIERVLYSQAIARASTSLLSRN